VKKLKGAYLGYFKRHVIDHQEIHASTSYLNIFKERGDISDVMRGKRVKEVQCIRFLRLEVENTSSLTNTTWAYLFLEDISVAQEYNRSATCSAFSLPFMFLSILLRPSKMMTGY